MLPVRPCHDPRAGQQPPSLTRTQFGVSGSSHRPGSGTVDPATISGSSPPREGARKRVIYRTESGRSSSQADPAARRRSASAFSLDPPVGLMSRAGRSVDDGPAAGYCCRRARWWAWSFALRRGGAGQTGRGLWSCDAPSLGPVHGQYTRRPLTAPNHRNPQRRRLSNTNGLHDYQRPPATQTMTSRLRGPAVRRGGQRDDADDHELSLSGNKWSEIFDRTKESGERRQDR